MMAFSNANGVGGECLKKSLAVPPERIASTIELTSVSSAWRVSVVRSIPMCKEVMGIPCVDEMLRLRQIEGF